MSESSNWTEEEWADLEARYALLEEKLCKDLASQEQALGPLHPDTLTSVNNLAAPLESKGDWACAEPMA